MTPRTRKAAVRSRSAPHSSSDHYQAWQAAHHEATLAYRDWRDAGHEDKLEAYVVYRAAADREDAAATSWMSGAFPSQSASAAA